MIGKEEHLVSVVIPCYNYARYLGEAVESVLAQSYPHFEIIVVDDGSTDNIVEAVARFPKVRLIRQKNQGLSAARNTGLWESKGSYLVFLDADDRLLPDALERGVNSLSANPACAFVVGQSLFISADGSALPTTPRYCDDEDIYRAFLSRNYIRMTGMVMFRRSVFDSVSDFDTSFDACSDYDLYLRITRDFPVHFHNHPVAEYRKHGENMSYNSALMMKTILEVIRSQRAYVKGKKKYEDAYRIGIRFYQEYYGDQLMNQVRRHLRAREWGSIVGQSLAFLRHSPRGFIKHASRKLSLVFSNSVARPSGRDE
ncbi:MAG TPA: glycosyltransferase [Blastocatellia bacterium]|nr:glycosyltransferase [Blastocatellia bacterium]